jgi:hypothetical protein
MRSTVLIALLSLALASPASAFFKCKSWTRLDDEQKTELLEQQTDKTLEGNVARQYQVNRVTIRKCMIRYIPEMRDQFDGICAEGKSASLQALNREFERYLFSCVGQPRR